MSELLDKYRAAIQELNDAGDEEMEDALLLQLDSLWYQMTPAEREQTRQSK